MFCNNFTGGTVLSNSQLRQPEELVLGGGFKGVDHLGMGGNQEHSSSGVHRHPKGSVSRALSH